MAVDDATRMLQLCILLVQSLYVVKSVTFFLSASKTSNFVIFVIVYHNGVNVNIVFLCYDCVRQYGWILIENPLVMQVNARILFIDPSTRAVGLTMNPHLLLNKAPPLVSLLFFPWLTFGTVIDYIFFLRFGTSLG